MTEIERILKLAQQRSEAEQLGYAGALLPAEAHLLQRQLAGARLVDVRTRAEWSYVGRIPGSIEIEWQGYPGGQANASFITELSARMDRSDPVLFICRSGVRSHAAALAATAAGFVRCYNVLEGFQGDKDGSGHRDSVGGWRVAGLPWYQN